MSDEQTYDVETGEVLTTEGTDSLNVLEISPINSSLGITPIGAPRPITPEAVNMIISALAPAWRESNWFGIRSPEQAMVLMVMAYELGFPMSNAFNFFDVIPTSGGTRITLKPKGALALIYRSGLLAKNKMIIKDKGDSCYVYMQRRDNNYGFGFEFTMDMARRAGLVKPKGAWETYPENMLRWRCISIVSSIVFPDVLSGMNLATDFIDITPDEVTP